MKGVIVQSKTIGATRLHSAMQRFLELPWAPRFAIACTTGLAVIFVLCWIVFGFDSLGLDPRATITVALGITSTIGLDVGLMTLVFHSNRSGQDDALRNATVARQEPAHRPKN